MHIKIINYFKIYFYFPIFGATIFNNNLKIKKMTLHFSLHLFNFFFFLYVKIK